MVFYEKVKNYTLAEPGGLRVATDDERVFRTGAYVRCGLLALVLAVFGTGARLRGVAGVPPARSGSPSPARTRSIELRTRGTSPSRGHGYAC